MVRIKRVYEEREESDGERILVDRLWPRGVRKTDERIDAWMKELAPSNELRTWFGHNPQRWDEFRSRYREELSQPEKARPLKELLQLIEQGKVTLVFAASDIDHNNAIVLSEFMEDMKARQGPR